MMLMRVSPQFAVVTAEVMVMPRSRSLLHPVHRRRALVNLTRFVNAPRVEQDALSKRRLARVDVRGNPDVAGFV